MAQTTVVNRRAVKADYYNISRPTKWGNPYTHLANKPNLIQMPSREAAIDEYRGYLIFQRHDLLIQLPELIGKKLGCWCHPEPCHGDVLIEMIDMYQAGLICRQCGCSNDCACPDGCCWFEPGLCSVCAEDPDHGPEDVMEL